MFFSIRRLQATSLRLYNRSSRALLLETGKADEALNNTKSQMHSIIDIFFLKYCLDFRLLRLSSWGFFLNISKKNFSKHFERLAAEKMSVRSYSECLENNNSV